MFLMGMVRFKFSNKPLLFIVLLTGGLLLLPGITQAQDIPCDGSDPFSAPCPLDTYVWVLAIIALILGAVYLHRQQKLQSKTQ
jgi:hypothetical protein